MKGKLNDCRLYWTSVFPPNANDPEKTMKTIDSIAHNTKNLYLIMTSIKGYLYMTMTTISFLSFG